ncbi:MAG TPA: hypothetical protein VH560_03205 [Polyangia bacterium]|nr:hypothetical protein [Polyangia bacterium]
MGRSRGWRKDEVTHSRVRAQLKFEHAHVVGEATHARSRQMAADVGEDALFGARVRAKAIAEEGGGRLEGWARGLRVEELGREVLELALRIVFERRERTGARVQRDPRVEDALLDREVHGDEIADLREEARLVSHGRRAQQGREEPIDLAVLRAQKISCAVVIS